jgi:trehalose 6-phosphate synthase/phosphatase
LDGVDVFIISGRSTADLDAWMSGYGFTLVAEHGFYIRTPDDEGWRVFDERANLGWMDQVRDVLAYHAGMTPGSTIEMKRASIVWHYRESDPEYGLWKAHQIVSELSEIMANDPVGIHHGKKIVEVGSIQISKGAVVEHLLSRKNYRNVICAGDDATDETMFRLKDSRFTRIKVGEGETSADYRVQSPGEFRRLLRKAVETLNRIECAAH